MREDNYFSWNNIGEMADINSHIHYAKTLLNKYEWASLTKRNIDKQLNAITKKQNDKQLNISVIGEFSTGKSSFINALVGFELLAVNILQGTTIAITIIEYSDEFAITLTDFDEASTKETYANIDSLRQHLHLYTTDPKYGKKINYVTVTLPSPILKRGFRIIDTPGTNSLELWHEEVTKKAIAELSDLSIILVDATKAMPETLMAFVDNTLGTAVKDCVFVANKIDLIKDRERNSIVRYVGIKAAQNFEIEEPVIFPFSSVALTNTFSRDKVKVDDDSFMLTTNSLGNLLSHTANQRVKAQARKVLQLIEDMYAILARDILKIAKTYNAQLKKL
jgi:tRNA U34 5-carboxymethylaminomethyl modifying GTPase MnmE/TrmE